MKKRFIGLICLIGLICPIFSAKAEETTLPTVDQTEATALTITPSVFEGVLEQGKTSSQTFELKNNSQVPLPIKCYIRNFDASDEEGGVNIPESADINRLSPRNWISVVSPDFIIQPQSSRNISINFNPPADLPPGGYYGILFAEPLLPESFTSSSSLSIGGRLGSLLFLVSPGDISEKGSIASVDFPRLILNSPPPDLKIRFQNSGNVHLKPSGKIIITNLISKKSSSSEVPEFTVLPARIRQQIVGLGAVKWPGVYSLKLQLNYGRDKIGLEKDITFYYLPIKPIVVILVLIGTLIAIVFGKSRRRIVKAMRAVIKG